MFCPEQSVGDMALAAEAWKKSALAIKQRERQAGGGLIVEERVETVGQV